MNTKPVFFVLICISVIVCTVTHAQTGYIYTHLKHVSEENSPTATTPPDYSFVLRNSSGMTISSFGLNDQATSDNVPNSGNFLSGYDIGLSHGTGGDGQLWAVTGTALGMSEATASSGASNSSINNATGGIYYRNAGSSVWMQANNGTSPITGVRYIDGAYANQCVYSTASGVYFYNNGTVTQISNNGGVNDVTANGGRIAISMGTSVYVYSNTYSAAVAPATGGNWIALSATTVTSGSRIDMNLSANAIAVEYAKSNTVKTIGFTVTSATAATSTVATLASPGNSAASYWDVAYDDLGTIYATAYSSSLGSELIFSYTGSAWVAEAQSRLVEVVTGGAAHIVYGLNIEGPYNISYPTSCNSIFSRQTDNAGNFYWIDDERIKSSALLNGNGIVIPVSPGTYTLTETLPNSSTYDLSRYNIYDPGGSTSGNVNTQVVTYVVTANELVFAEYVNESLAPKAIALTCTFQYLQTFDAATSSPVKTYTYGSGTYGNNIEGTSYHYWRLPGADDGYYSLAKTTGSLNDHTGNGGYLLLVNASYAKDEFYRQRVTNLVPGLSYTIAFWMANISPTAPLQPNVTFGLQDTLGNIINSTSTGTVSSSSWVQFSFTFTATTSRADLFLTNNNIGGAGNDLAIDDISINPVLPTLAASSGSSAECVGANYNFTNAQSGGIWTSSDKTIATINSKSGTTRAVGAGTAIITYSYTNAIGCTGTASSVITVTAPPVAAATDKFGGQLCINQTDSLYATITTTSTAPYTYAWSASPATGSGLGMVPLQNTSATPTVAGSYTFVALVTDALGCTAAASVAVNVNNKTAPTVSASVNVVSLACVSPVIASLNGGVSGSLTPKYSYVWSGPGTILAPSSGSISATNYNTSATSTAAGQYTLTVTDGNGCIASATAATIISSSLSVAASTYATVLCTGGSGTKDSLYSTVTGGLAPYTYAWARAALSSGTVTYSPGSTYANTGVSISGATNNSLQSFTITVTDANRCTALANTSFTVKTVTGPTINSYAAATVCFGTPIIFPASVVAGSGAVNSYVWSSSPAATGGLYHTTSTSSSKDTALPTVAGSYIFTLNATDANGCEASYNTGIQTVNPAVAVTATANTSAFCSTTGTDQLYAVASGGSGTYSTYAWTTAVVTTPGTTSLNSTSIYNPAASITGASTGSAFKYSVTVTDSKGCIGTASTTSIVVATSPTVSAVTATASSTCASGTATIALAGTFSNGTAPYNYAWTAPTGSVVTPSDGTTSTSPLTASATAPVAQTYAYSLTVVDNNNCTASGSSATAPITLNDGLSITATASTTGPICASPATSINLTSTVSGGSGTYTYAWSGPGGTITTATSQNPTAIPTTTGAYIVTVNDGNGCTGADTTAIITVDQATPSISLICGTNSNNINYARLIENNGTSWIWTTTSGGKFYPDNTLSTSNDASTSTLQAPFVTYNGTYNVVITDAAGCNGSGFITLTSSSCNVILATSNLNFAAVKQGNEALLAWSTSAETNNSYFNIERSADGINWQVVATVQGKGNSTVLTNYSFLDALPLSGTNYYRLKQVDANGRYSYSPVKSLQFTGQWLVKLYPNPVQNYLVLEFNNDKDEKANITIQNALGSTVFITGQQLVTGLNRITLNQVQPLAAGTYILTLATTENIFHSKFVKGGD